MNMNSTRLTTLVPLHLAWPKMRSLAYMVCFPDMMRT